MQVTAKNHAGQDFGMLQLCIIFCYVFAMSLLCFAMCCYVLAMFLLRFAKCLLCFAMCLLAFAIFCYVLQCVVMFLLCVCYCLLPFAIKILEIPDKLIKTCFFLCFVIFLLLIPFGGLIGIHSKT